MMNYVVWQLGSKQKLNKIKRIMWNEWEKKRARNVKTKANQFTWFVELLFSKQVDAVHKMFHVLDSFSVDSTKVETSESSTMWVISVETNQANWLHFRMFAVLIFILLCSSSEHLMYDLWHFFPSHESESVSVSVRLLNVHIIMQISFF